jgi:hypothetical protein
LQPVRRGGRFISFFSFHPPRRKSFFISLAKAQRRKGESKAVLCVLAALRELLFFFAFGVAEE